MPAGRAVFQQGQLGNTFYIIVSGRYGMCLVCVGCCLVRRDRRLRHGTLAITPCRFAT
jgi:hypothetical protein